VAGDDGLEWVGHPKDAPWDKLDGHTWVSHNAYFDQAVFQRLRVLGIAPDVSPDEWHCTADMVAYLQYPRSLAAACKELYDAKLAKDVRAAQSGKSYTGDLFKPDDELTEYAMEDALFKPDDELTEYAMEDARWCLRLWLDHAHKWPKHERRLSHLTRMWGMAGVCIDSDRLETDMKELSRLRWEAEQQLPWLDGGDTVVLSLKNLASECRKAGIEPPPSLAMDNEDCEAWLEKYGETYPWVGAMRQWRRTNMLLTKYEAIRRRVLTNNRMAYGLKYCGAQHTGRWSGDAGVNMQNLPRGELFGCNLRKCFVPSPGHKFVVADFSQIEPRVLAWLAEDTKLLDEIAKHHDFYEAQARAMGLWEGDKPLKSNPKLRHMVTGLNLGLGYGMSWKRFADITGMDTDEAKRLVNLYREKNAPVLDMWSGLERMVKKAGGNEDRTLKLDLPSGRIIHYFNIRRDKGLTAEVVRGKDRKYIWGGFLTENMTQAVAREVMAAALLRVNEIPDCQIVWHVHDEIVAEVPAEIAETKQREIEEAMCQPPEWAADLPVAVESSIEEAYTK
jgi:DNA polymerase I-like protein with 3'-5' exonuclease and polymerase domains